MEAVNQYDAVRELVTVARHAENALADYVPTLEKRGSTMGYGNAVLRQLRAALVPFEETER